MKTYDHRDMQEALQTVVSASGLKKVSESTGVSVAFISAVTTGRKSISPRLLDYLGFERVEAEPRYRRKAK